VPLGAVRRPFLIEPCAPFVLPTGHELEVSRIDAGGEPASMVRLVPGRDRPPVSYLPGHVMTATDLFPDSDERIAVFVECALISPAAGRRSDGVADEFLPEGHRWECSP
jgi:hypothetical protein